MRNCEQKCSLLRERKRSMVNEQRLHSMIKIAKFDANDGKRCKPMIQYARKDYVALQLLKSFVVGTIAFFMMLGLWVLYSIEQSQCSSSLYKIHFVDLFHQSIHRIEYPKP